MGQANYAAAKEGIVGLTRTCALDLGRYGVTVNAIRPAAGTRLTLSPEMEEARQRRLAARGEEAEETEQTPADAEARLDAMRPELIAPLVVYLCTDAAQNVNGRDFSVGGNEVALMTKVTREIAIIREGGWDLDALDRVFPNAIGRFVENPAEIR